MTVTVSWSSSNGGTAISSLSHGSVGNGSESSAQTIYLRHGGTYAITDCGFYVQAIPISYGGDFTADADLAEFLAWGDASTSAEFGGLFLNLNATGSFPAASWPTVTSKSVSLSGNVVGVAMRTSVGDSPTAKVGVITQMGCTTDDEIQAGSAPNVRFQCKFSIPNNEDTLGTRSIRMSLVYEYTS